MASTAADPGLSPYDRIGGMAVFRAITDRFYDLMEAEPGFAALRAIHAADLAPMRASLPLFLAGWAGGPRDWWDANPGKCMMSMHAPMVIGQDVARQWADAMARAIADVAPAEREMAEALSAMLTRMALGMARN
ncbi:group II truncated hemoglobin [Novosphingobium sp.]|uniref:group II truncated hemoglobin n=1 Tax=Novosphingobium sp. TaxID=1874826 RepID=UPI0033400B52